MIAQKLNTLMKYSKEKKWAEIVRMAARKVLIQIRPILSPVLFESINFYLLLGYWPNLRNPESFCEKLVFRKLFRDNPLYSIVSDKWAVREFVAGRASKNLSNEV